VHDSQDHLSEPAMRRTSLSADREHPVHLLHLPDHDRANALHLTDRSRGHQHRCFNSLLPLDRPVCRQPIRGGGRNSRWLGSAAAECCAPNYIPLLAVFRQEGVRGTEGPPWATVIEQAAKCRLCREIGLRCNASLSVLCSLGLCS
jgi:hypothetical protein